MKISTPWIIFSFLTCLAAAANSVHFENLVESKQSERSEKNLGSTGLIPVVYKKSNLDTRFEYFKPVPARFKQLTKIEICHRGRISKLVNQRHWKRYLRQGAHLGKCGNSSKAHFYNFLQQNKKV